MINRTTKIPIKTTSWKRKIILITAMMDETEKNKRKLSNHQSNKQAMHWQETQGLKLKKLHK